jgi:hypothetical protein
MNSKSNHLNSYLLLSTLAHLIPAPMGWSLAPSPSLQKPMEPNGTKFVYMLHDLIFKIVLIDCYSYAASGLYFSSIPGLRYSHIHHHHSCTTQTSGKRGSCDLGGGGNWLHLTQVSHPATAHSSVTRCTLLWLATFTVHTQAMSTRFSLFSCHLIIST